MNFFELSKTVLFRGITPQEIESMMTCLGTDERSFSKGEMIYRSGDVVSALGIVLSGSVFVEADDFWGKKTILDKVGAGQVFAEAYACTPGEPLMINVVAAENTKVLFLNMDRVITTCSAACQHHGKLIRNLLSLAAQKNLTLSRKIFHTSSKSIRGRLMSYLSYQAVLNGSRRFSLPLNRQQLADDLNVERSSLSSELGKMQKDGLIRIDRNRVELLDSWQDF